MKVSRNILLLIIFILITSNAVYSAIIDHIPVLEAKAGNIIKFEANVIDSDSSGVMNLYIKTDFSSNYIKYKMEKSGNKFTYDYSVPIDVKFLYYYLEYENGSNINFGSSLQPFSVKVNRRISGILLLDPDDNATFDENRVLVTVSLFNAQNEDIEDIKIYIDGTLFKEIQNPDKILYVYETGNLVGGGHKIELYTDGELIASHIFYIKSQRKFHFSGYSSDKFSYTGFSGDSSAYSNQDTTTFNGYSISNVRFIVGQNMASAGYNMRMHNAYRNMFYLSFENGIFSADIGDYSSKFISNFVNSLSFRGFDVSLGDFYIFHGSQNSVREGSVNGTDTTFGSYREISTGIILNNPIVKLGGLYNRDDSNSIKIGISPMENIVLNFALSIPIKFIKLYSSNSVSLTTLNSNINDSIFDYKIGFFRLNTSTIPLSISNLPFLSTISGLELNSSFGNVKLEYFRKGSGYINTLFDRQNNFEQGIRYYNSFFFKGFTLTGNFEFRYPENQDIKSINIYLSKLLNAGYLFTNFIYTSSKAYYFGTLSENNANYYLTLGDHFRLQKITSITAILSLSRYKDEINTGTDDIVTSMNLYGKLPPVAGILFSPGFQLGFSQINGIQYALSLNTQYGIKGFLINNYLGYYDVQNAIYAIDNADVSYKWKRFTPSLGIYFQKNFTAGSNYTMYKTYVKISYAF